MKKKIAVFVTVLMLAFSICLTVGGVVSSASFGSGARVVAADVNMIKTGLVGQRLRFSDADFKSAVCLADFDAIKITKIPSSTEGALLLEGRRVGEGKIIKRSNIGSLTFMPASDSVKECSFKFVIEGYASGAEIECILKFIDRVNYMPNASFEAVSAKTQEGISYYGTMYGSDPEGDKLTFIVVAYPKNGILEVLDEESGSYSYTPIGDFKGDDKFTYVVRDSYGNYSKPETVNVKVTERMCEIVYRDMTDRSEYNAAIALTAMNIMGGSVIGDGVYFMPDKEVSRAEFVSMAMRCCGMRADTTLTESCFDDNSEIFPALRSYIATAQRIGIINGDFKDGKLVFNPNESITKYEAAKIMAGILGTGNAPEENVFAEDEDVPVWARAGVAAMCTLGVFDSSDSACLTANVTRADAAEYLYKMVGIVR